LTPAVVEAISSLVNVEPEAMSEVAYATVLPMPVPKFHAVPY